MESLEVLSKQIPEIPGHDRVVVLRAAVSFEARMGRGPSHDEIVQEIKWVWHEQQRYLKQRKDAKEQKAETGATAGRASSSWDASPQKGGKRKGQEPWPSWESVSASLQNSSSSWRSWSYTQDDRGRGGSSGSGWWDRGDTAEGDAPWRRSRWQ